MATAAHTQGQARPRACEPALLECIGLLLFVFVVQLFEYSRHAGLLAYASNWLDTPSYVALADVIRNHSIADGDPHFLGFPIAIALTSKLFSVSLMTAVIIVCVSTSLGAFVIIHRLFGGTATVWFLILSVEWTQLSLLGGSEPLFTLLFLASFACARSEKWRFAALLGSLATMVRIVGIFALLGFAVALARKRKWRELVSAFAISVLFGLAYLWFAHRVAGGVFSSFAAYRTFWESGWPITIPLKTITESSVQMFQERRWYVFLRYLIWAASFLVLSCMVFFTCTLKPVLRSHQSETVAVAAYVLFYFSYNESDLLLWIPRFMLPVLPFILFAVKPSLPTDRRILWPATGISALFAAAAIVGFRAVFGFSMHR